MLYPCAQGLSVWHTPSRLHLPALKACPKQAHSISTPRGQTCHQGLSELVEHGCPARPATSTSGLTPTHMLLHPDLAHVTLQAQIRAARRRRAADPTARWVPADLVSVVRMDASCVRLGFVAPHLAAALPVLQPRALPGAAGDTRCV